MERVPAISYTFGPFRIDGRSRRLTCDGAYVHLTPLSLHALVFLAQNSGRIVSKSELLAEIWPDTLAEDTNLAVMISGLRKALGDNGQTQKYIQTVTKSGYRFAGEVRATVEAFDGLVVVQSASCEQERTQKPPIATASLAGPSRRKAMLAAAIVCLVLACSWLWNNRLDASPKMMELSPSGQLERAGSDRIPNEAALSWYRKGRYCISRRTKAGIQQGITYFEKAVQEEPQYAAAHAALAEAWLLGSSWSAQDPRQAYEQAKAAAGRAIAIDDSHGDSHTSLGAIALNYEGDRQTAERELRRAVQLAPKSPRARQWLGRYLASVGDLSESLAELARARDLDPLSLSIGADIGRVFHYSRDYEKAIAEFRSVLQLDPHFSYAYYLLGASYIQKGRFPEAIQALNESVRLSNNEPLALGLSAAALALSGNEISARQTIKTLQARSASEYISPLSLAVAFIGLGRKQEALVWMEKAANVYVGSVLTAQVDPMYDSLREEPLFIQLMNNIKSVKAGNPERPSIQPVITATVRESLPIEASR